MKPILSWDRISAQAAGGGAGRVFHRYREKEKYELYEKNVKKSDLFGYGIAVDTWNDAVICNG